MMDEQVKEGLECCVVEAKCNACPYIKDRDCREKINTDALTLINRLEKESADKERYTIELYNRAREAEREINKWKQAFIEIDKFGDMTTPIGLLPINTEGMRKLVDYCNQIRKETAKEILQQLIEWNNRETPLIADIQELAEKYGIEVEE